MAEDTDLDATIAALEAKIVAYQDAVAALRKAKEALDSAGIAAVGAGPRTNPEIGPDRFFKRSIIEASQEYLRLVGRPARPTAEIIEGLKAGGLQRVSPGSVTTILMRSDSAGGPVVRVQKGMWGLAEWYGNKKARPLVRRVIKVTKDDGTVKTADELIDERLADETEDQHVKRAPVE